MIMLHSVAARVLDKVHMEGNVLQIFYLGFSFCFM